MQLCGQMFLELMDITQEPTTRFEPGPVVLPEDAPAVETGDSPIDVDRRLGWWHEAPGDRRGIDQFARDADEDEEDEDLDYFYDDEDEDDLDEDLDDDLEDDLDEDDVDDDFDDDLDDDFDDD
jgi:hypothetical protein